MKTITKKIPASEITFYVTSDGKDFISQSSAEQHEKELEYNRRIEILNQCKSVGIDVLSEGIPERWIYIETSEQLDAWKKDNGFDNKTNSEYHGDDFSSIPNWFGCYTEYGGDYADRYHYWTINGFKKHLNDIWEQITTNMK